MNTVSNNNIARAIYLVFKGKENGEQSLISKKVVRFLAKKRLLFKAPDILLHLNKIVSEHEGKVTVKVSSAKRIDETTNKKLAEILIRRYKAKEIDFEENIDEKLLGGFKIEVNDEVIDLTIRNKIEKLQEYLTRPL